MADTFTLILKDDGAIVLRHHYQMGREVKAPCVFFSREEAESYLRQWQAEQRRGGYTITGDELFLSEFRKVTVEILATTLKRKEPGLDLDCPEMPPLKRVYPDLGRRNKQLSRGRARVAGVIEAVRVATLGRLMSVIGRLDNGFETGHDNASVGPDGGVPDERGGKGGAGAAAQGLGGEGHG